MYKIAAMGDRDSVFGFASIGLDVFPITDSAVASKKLKELALNNYAVIYITEALASEIKDIIEKYKDETTPAIILIPGVSGNTSEGINSVAKSVERAVGSQIL